LGAGELGGTRGKGVQGVGLGQFLPQPRVAQNQKNMYLLIIFYNYSKMEFKLYSLIPFPLLNYSSY
jgi:hypothetical protein